MAGKPYVSARLNLPTKAKLDRRTHLCLDHSRRVMVVFLGKPRTAEDWPLVASEGSRCLKDAAARMSLKEAAHRRGFHASVPHGISFGGGQEVCV